LFSISSKCWCLAGAPCTLASLALCNQNISLYRMPPGFHYFPDPFTRYFYPIDKRLSSAISAVELHRDSMLAGVEDEDLRASAAGHVVLLAALVPGSTAAFSSLLCWVLGAGCWALSAASHHPVAGMRRSPATPLHAELHPGWPGSEAGLEEELLELVGEAGGQRVAGELAVLSDRRSEEEPALTGAHRLSSGWVVRQRQRQVWGLVSALTIVALRCRHGSRCSADCSGGRQGVDACPGIMRPRPGCPLRCQPQRGVAD
jgi:hypothetical protein